METEEVIKLVDGIYKVSGFVSMKGVGGVIIIFWYMVSWGSEGMIILWS